MRDQEEPPTGARRAGATASRSPAPRLERRMLPIYRNGHRMADAFESKPMLKIPKVDKVFRGGVEEPPTPDPPSRCLRAAPQPLDSPNIRPQSDLWSAPRGLHIRGMCSGLRRVGQTDFLVPGPPLTHPKNVLNLVNIWTAPEIC
jgi:hypothetical protein